MPITLSLPRKKTWSHAFPKGKHLFCSISEQANPDVQHEADNFHPCPLPPAPPRSPYPVTSQHGMTVSLDGTSTVSHGDVSDMLSAMGIH